MKNYAFQILSKEDIQHLSDYMRKINIDENQLEWEEFDAKFPTIRRNIRHVITSLRFRSNTERGSALTIAIEYLQNFFDSNNRNRNNEPISFFRASDARYLYLEED